MEPDDTGMRDRPFQMNKYVFTSKLRKTKAWNLDKHTVEVYNIKSYNSITLLSISYERQLLKNVLQIYRLYFC